jgi:hypothetical protein
MAYIPQDAKWYLADVVMQIRIDGEPRSVVHVNTLLVRADSPEQAYDEAIALGRAAELTYENSDGRAVHITFRGLADLNVIHDDLAHGAELAYREHVGLSEEEIQGRLRQRADLGIFSDSQPSPGPNYMPGDILDELRQAGYEGPEPWPGA